MNLPATELAIDILYVLILILTIALAFVVNKFIRKINFLEKKLKETNSYYMNRLNNHIAMCSTRALTNNSSLPKILRGTIQLQHKGKTAKVKATFFLK